MADGIAHVVRHWIMRVALRSPAPGGFAVLAHWPPVRFFSVWSGVPMTLPAFTVGVRRDGP